MIERVITGGQTGSDQAGWRAAKAAGIRCSGWMPKGFRTEGRVNHAGFLTTDESHPEFAELYGAKEYHSNDYPSRTRHNLAYIADEAGVAVCFDANPRMSPGTKCLVGAHADLIRRGLAVSLVVIKVARGPDGYRVANDAYGPAWVVKEIVNAQATRLMVAGNRESSAPGIGAWVERYLAEAFRLLALSAPDPDGEARPDGR